MTVSRIVGRLAVVPLEDRCTPATFTVTTVLDNGDNSTPLSGSLRAAIISANTTAGDDTITFNITGTGVQAIALKNELPAITEGVTLDGTTQPGSTTTPAVRILGTNAGLNVNGLTLLNHTNSTIRGLNIAGFDLAAIRIEGGSGHKITNNFIGLNQTGTAADANGTGVQVVNSAGNSIGGSTEFRNFISGNRGDGVQVVTSRQTIVAGNTIGADLNGVNPIGNGGNGVAVANGATATTIGGAASGTGNILVANVKSGVRIVGAATAGTVVQGNRIGQDTAGNAQPNISDGVTVEAAVGTQPAAGNGLPDSSTTIRSNTIQNNKGSGVAVRDTTRFVRIVDNSIDKNTSLGISIDATANNGLKAPNITTVDVPSTGGSVVNVTVSGQPNTSYDVTIYGVDTPDASGNGEGSLKAATVTVTPLLKPPSPRATVAPFSRRQPQRPQPATRRYSQMRNNDRSSARCHCKCLLPQGGLARLPPP
jgi:hypothetical protein